MVSSEVFRMATSTLVPLSEYLTTSYRPDCDWIEGEVRERNTGEGSHAAIQGFLIGFFRQHRADWQIRVWPEQRVQVAEMRYRIPDVCLTRMSAPFEEMIHTPPLLCIEILSRDDRMSDMQERVDDYFGMGVEAVWVIDPKRRREFSADVGGSLQAVIDQLAIAGTAVGVPVAQIFAELDELQGLIR